MATGSSRGFPVTLLISLACGAWLLATRFLSGYLVDALTELQWLLVTFLALPVFVWAAVLSVVHLLRAPDSARRTAALPLAISTVALALYVAPMPLIDDLDFQRHYTARMEAVGRIESGELWNGSPAISVTSLPRPDYPTSVSNGAGQRSVQVYREDGALHVVFHPVTGGLLDGHPAILYRADGQPPSVPDRVLPTAASSERLDAYWHRVRFADPPPFHYVALLQMVLVLTLAIGVVLVPLALGVHLLASRRTA